MFQTLVQVAVYATILGTFVAVAAWMNGRRTTGVMKGLIRELGGKMDEGFKLMARLIVEENEKTRKEILEALAK